MAEPMIANKGLAGLIADDTAVSKVDIEIKSLIYRGYDINELCKHSTFIEVAFLLMNGELPTLKELEEFSQFEKENREIPDEVYEMFKLIPKHTHPMDYLKLGVAHTATFDKDNKLGDISHESNMRKAKLMLAKIPTILANSYRAVHNMEFVRPDKTLSYSRNFLNMMPGVENLDKLTEKAFDASLILYAEHGFNASTFSTRVTASTMSDFYSAVVSGIGTLKGPLHGGANEQVMYMLKEIGSVENAENFLRKKLAEKAKIMGFGHRLYRTGDSRTAVIKTLGLQLANQTGETQWHEISQILEDIMIKEKKIYPNLDFPAATAYYLMGIPIDLYTPIFVASRITGWSAHIIEQHDDNRLIRPGCRYIGKTLRKYVSLEKR